MTGDIDRLFMGLSAERAKQAAEIVVRQALRALVNLRAEKVRARPPLKVERLNVKPL